jgi:hypothetical protein
MFDSSIVCKYSPRKKAANIVKMHQNPTKNCNRIPSSEESKGKINQELSYTAQQYINSGIQQSGTPT